MVTNHVAKLLSAYCHNELPEAEMQRVKIHLQSCTNCRQAYDQIKFGMSLAQQLTTTAAPDSLWFDVMKQNAAPAISKGFNWRMATAIASVLVLAFLGWFGFSRLGQTQNPKQEIVNNLPKEKVESTPNVIASPTHSEPGKKITSVPNAQQKTKFPTPKIASPSVASWEVASVSGAPSIGENKISGTEKIAVGEWLETDNSSRAKIKVADIGFVNIDPNSQVQLVKTQTSEHRIALKKGKLSAFIMAPPRLFVVDTPSATAVDLGCAYTLEVDEAGNSLLHVTSGWVSFVLRGRESFIPAGAMCATRKGEGIGTPYFANASEAFKSTLQKLDFSNGEIADTLVAKILTEARAEDALTLWHLLDQPKWQTGFREQIFDRLAVLTPPPSGVTRAGILSSNRKMLDRWWHEKIQ